MAQSTRRPLAPAVHGARRLYRNRAEHTAADALAALTGVQPNIRGIRQLAEHFRVRSQLSFRVEPQCARLANQGCRSQCSITGT